MEKTKAQRQLFTEEEDMRLKHIMETVEFEKWSQIAALLGGNKNPRQCRDRWVNYLSPGVKKLEWTEEEDLILVQSYQNLGKKWSKITNYLPGRSENHIKNRWHSYLKKHFENEKNLSVAQIKQIIRENHAKNSIDGSKIKHQNSSSNSYKKRSPPVVDPYPNFNFPLYPQQNLQYQQFIPQQQAQQSQQQPMNMMPMQMPMQQQFQQVPVTQQNPQIQLQEKIVKEEPPKTEEEKPNPTNLVDQIFAFDDRNPINLFPDTSGTDLFSLF